MAKLDFKTLLVDKGEKFALYICAGVMVLFIAIGAYSAMDAKDPQQITTEMKKKAEEIGRNIDSQTAEVNPLPEWARSVYKPDSIDGKKFAVKLPLFDPIAKPDDKRSNPLVVKPAEIQADMVAAKIPAYDIIEEVRNGEVFLRVGTVQFKDQKGQRAPDLGTWRNQFNDQIRKIPKGPRLQHGTGDPMGGNPMGPGPMGPGPMGPGPMGPGPAGAIGGRDGGAPSGPGGFPMPGGAGGVGGVGGGFDANEKRGQVIYVSLDNEKELEGKRLALTIYPQRMVVLHASLPFREQLEEIRRALKLATIADVLTTEGAQPFFRGKTIQGATRAPTVDVERRTVYANGKTTDWAPLNYLENFRGIFMRKIADQPDPVDLAYVKLHPAHRLVMPLPFSASKPGYPEVRLKTIVDTIEKQKNDNKPPAAAKAPNQLRGEGDVFGEQSAPRESGNLFGTPEGGGAAGMSGLGMPFGPRPGGNSPIPGEGQPSTTTIDQIAYALVRVIDTDIRPGLRYQYRMRVSMENPNYKKKELVSKPSDADVEVLTGAWTEMTGTVSVPPESFLYAIDPPPDPLRKGLPMAIKDGQAVMQIQRWQAQIQVDRHKEPFGDWFVAEFPVTRGTVVGSRTLVNLPLWSSEQNSFLLREYTPPKATPKSKQPDPVKGVMMDLARPDLLVVDVEGGKIKTYGTGRKALEDETIYEVLLMTEDGKLQLHTTATDRDDAERIAREKRWQAWTSEVDKAKPANPNDPSGRFGENLPKN